MVAVRTHRGIRWTAVTIAVVTMGAAMTTTGSAQVPTAMSAPASTGQTTAGPTADPTATPLATLPIPAPVIPGDPAASAPPGPAPSPIPSGTPPPPPDRTDPAWPRNPPWDACPRPVWPGELASGSPGEGRRVLVIGDSLTRNGRRPLQSVLRSSGWTPTLRCWGSRRLDWGLAQVARARKLDQLPDFVVIALGTNDVSWVTPSVTQARVRTLLDRLGPRRQVLWVDLDVDFSAFSARRADWFNRMIRQQARGRSNVRIVDWERQARRHGAWRWDGIHYGTRGSRLRAEAIGRALDAHARSLTP